VIEREQFLGFCDAALTAMADITTSLGDDLANRRPDLPGANSPVQILTHCLGVMGWWAGAVNLGRSVDRDRDAEFEAVCRVADLAADVERARRQLHDDVAAADPAAAPARPEHQHDYATQGAVLLHVYEELAQHRGQMEITRDVLVAAAGS
jgi:uncharacterized damage-inducible protein DinB